MSRALPHTSGRSNASRRSPSPSDGGRSSGGLGRFWISNADVAAASAIPGAVDAELASDSVMAKRVPHRGHFKRLPGLIPGGRFKMTPHCGTEWSGA